MDSFVRRIGLDSTHVVSLRDQFPRIRLLLVASFAIGLAGVIAVYALSAFSGVPLHWLTRDPADVTQTSFFVGSLSYVGIMAWSSATAICFFGAYLLSRYARFRQSVLFLFSSGIVCLILTLDDAFQLHEKVLPRHLHIPELVVFAVYLLILAGYLLYFFRQILSTDYLLFVLALVFLGVSASMDQILTFTNLETFAEDSLKFFGIVFWLAYFARATSTMIHDRLADPESSS